MSEKKTVAVLGNFTDPNKIMDAAAKVHQSGYTDFDIYTP
ncbi:MAG: quinol:electron acceptor oxidoreductase subunit ActD, partial [Ignavibacteria bacterium]